MKYVQSFYPYAVIYSSIMKGIPAQNADGELRNIAEVTEAELETLQSRESLFRHLVETKKYRVLNHLPESYKPSAVLVNEARTKASEAEGKNSELLAKIAELEAKLKEATEKTAKAKKVTKKTTEE